jgi:hypothetical protein
MGPHGITDISQRLNNPAQVWHDFNKVIGWREHLCLRSWSVLRPWWTQQLPH